MWVKNPSSDPCTWSPSSLLLLPPPSPSRAALPLLRTPRRHSHGESSDLVRIDVRVIFTGTITCLCKKRRELLLIAKVCHATLCYVLHQSFIVWILSTCPLFMMFVHSNTGLSIPACIDHSLEIWCIFMFFVSFVDLSKQAFAQLSFLRYSYRNFWIDLALNWFLLLASWSKQLMDTPIVPPPFEW